MKGKQTRSWNKYSCSKLRRFESWCSLFWSAYPIMHCLKTGSGKLLMLVYSIGSIRVAVIYRPPSSQIGAFLADFASLLEQPAADSDNLLIVGDFNFHVDDSKNTDVIKLHNLLESFSLKQLKIYVLWYRKEYFLFCTFRHSYVIFSCKCWTPDS